MNSPARGLAAFIALAWIAGAAWATGPVPQASGQAASALQLAQNLPGSGNNDPYSNPIRRANPNSMQGTQPATPPMRGPSTVPSSPAPSLENGGIGNGYPRGGVQRSNPDPRPPSPSYDANGNRR